jgi:hypothetical protein
MDIIEASRRIDAGNSTWEDFFLMVEYQIGIGEPVEQVIVFDHYVTSPPQSQKIESTFMRRGEHFEKEAGQ